MHEWESSLLAIPSQLVMMLVQPDSKIWSPPTGALKIEGTPLSVDCQQPGSKYIIVELMVRTEIVR